ncbi:uncharacterized protein VTP21DRAFT_4278 [Calcarisporiella thermophila]|uniref:uncharacterized protein n=1 Tax=Calcarisporiella thermophila TaxID=911321 RepID=UPI003742EAED
MLDLVLTKMSESSEQPLDSGCFPPPVAPIGVRGSKNILENAKGTGTAMHEKILICFSGRENARVVTRCPTKTARPKHEETLVAALSGSVGQGFP